MPVVWVNDATSKVKAGAYFSTLVDVVKLWRRLRRGEYDTPKPTMPHEPDKSSPLLS